MKGFTLLELLITLTIFALLCTIAIPGFNQLENEIQVEAAISQLYRAIQLTRSEAIKSNAIATICPSEEGYHCQSNWSKGYVVFIDKKANGEISPNDPLVQFFKPIKGEGTLLWNNFRNKNYLQYTSLGFTNSQNGTFLYCSKKRQTCRSLVVNRFGRLRIENSVQ